MRELRILVAILLSATILLQACPALLVKGENALPIASFTYSPNYPQPYELVTFDASQSYDPDGYIPLYQWNFGDGFAANVTNYPGVQHAYYNDGTYQVVLTVVDNQGGRSLIAVNVVVNCRAWFRVVDSSANPISNVKVTVYYSDSATSTNWQTTPIGPDGLEILYDYVTQPDMAHTSGQKYRNPGYSASILYDSASNIGFETHPSDWYVFFKFEWGSKVVYWPNETSRVFSYNHGTVVVNNYKPVHQAKWNAAAGTYVKKTSYIASDGVNPKSDRPIIVGFCGIPPLSVSISPSSANMDVGQSQILTSTVVGGSPPYSYQWYLNNNPVSGATSPTWAFTPASSGSYTVYLTITDSTTTQKISNVASVVVNAALSVSISPTSVILDVGQSKQFASSVSGGTSPYSYQWYLNSTPVSGATSSSWTFTPSSSGSYNVYVNVTDNVGVRAKSNIAFVTVNTALSVSILPNSVTMDVGQSMQFTSSVSGGTSPYTYQWYLNDAPVSGATSPTWTFTPSSAGSYTVYLKVTDNVGVQTTSDTVPVSVNGALSVAISPTSVNMDVGQSQLFTSSILGGASPYTCQWYLNDAAVSGATSSTWTFAPPSAGSYNLYVNVTDNVGIIAKSNIALITVSSSLSVSITPTFVTLDVGQSQLFTSSVSGGTSPYTYQWYLNGAPVSGATSTSWAFAPSSTGNYTIYVNATDNVGFRAKSNVAIAAVHSHPSVSILPTSAVLDVGQSQLFTSSVSGGTSPYTYQWYLNGNPVSGAMSATWTFIPSSAGSYTVYVIIDDGVGAHATSNIASVTVNGVPTVSIAPTSATMHVGDTLGFTSTILGGTSPYSYQWYLNSVPVSGATSSTWTFSQSAGSYTVYLNITDNLGVTAKSNVASLTVITVLAVIISPPSASIALGDSVDFTSTVNGGVAPYYFQWIVNGNPVSGATNASWTLTPSSVGTYHVYLNVTDSSAVKTLSNTVEVSVKKPSSVGGRSISVSVFQFLAPWMSVISLLAAAVMLKGIVSRKKRN